MQNLLIVLRNFIYVDTGDKELDAWKSIAKLLNERMDPTSYHEFRVYTGQSAKEWYERLEAEDNVYWLWWTMVKTCNDLQKSHVQRPDPVRLRSFVAAMN